MSNRQQHESSSSREVINGSRRSHNQSIAVLNLSTENSRIREIEVVRDPSQSGLSGSEFKYTDRGMTWRKELTTFKGRLAAIGVLVALVTPIAIFLSGIMTGNSRIHPTVSGNEESDVGENFKHYLTSNNLLTKSDLENPSSPQSRAFSWITERNLFQNDLYILATISFGLDGNNENSTLLEDNGEWCRWSWIGCTENGKVSKLNIYGKKLNGYLVNEIMHLRELKFVSISNSDIGGTIPSQLGSLVMLETLKLKDNELSGALPDEIWGLTNLKVLDLGGNSELEGTIPKTVADMVALEIFDITDCSIHGTIPSELGTLYDLRALRLGSNPDLNGTIPNEISQLKMLADFDVANCVDITGTIPTEFGMMNELEHVNLSFNHISGPIPTEIGNITTLKSLTMMSNPLEGSIPTELGNLPSLEYFNVKRSSLVGPIPTELGMLSNLKRFEVSGNRITGTVPAELGNIKELHDIDLCENEISGPVPKKWCSDKRTFIRYDCECCKNCY